MSSFCRVCGVGPLAPRGGGGRARLLFVFCLPIKKIVFPKTIFIKFILKSLMKLQKLKKLKLKKK